jgi:hypothetical protein
MPSQTFAFEPKGQRRLEISWAPFWKNITVKHDGKTIGTMADQKELKAGREFGLPDGSRIHVQLITTAFSVDLRVLRNGEPLPGSNADPAVRHQAAYGIIYCVAGLNLVLGLVAAVFQVRFLYQIGLNEYSILFGALFAILGHSTRKGSLLALILAIGLFALDSLSGFYFAISQGYTPSTAGLVARGFLLLPMLQGILAMRELKIRKVISG